MRWPISYVFLPVLAQMSSCQKVSWHTFVLCGNRGLRWHKSRKTKGCGRHPLVAWTLTCSHVNWCSLKAAWFNFASMALIWVYNLILWMDQWEATIFISEPMRSLHFNNLANDNCLDLNINGSNTQMLRKRLEWVRALCKLSKIISRAIVSSFWMLDIVSSFWMQAIVSSFWTSDIVCSFCMSET